jgi:hypothetical protein
MSLLSRGLLRCFDFNQPHTIYKGNLIKPTEGKFKNTYCRVTAVVAPFGCMTLQTKWWKINPKNTFKKTPS